MASWPAACSRSSCPAGTSAEPYASLFSGKTSFAQYVAEAKTRVDPVFDDRPFFFARQKPWGLPTRMRSRLLWILAGRSSALCAALPLPSASRSSEPVGPVRGLDRLLREPGPRLHRGGAGAAAAPDAAPRPPDLHAVDPALHAARLRRPRQRLERPLAARAASAWRGRRSPASTPSSLPRLVPVAPVPAARGRASRSPSWSWPRSASSWGCPSRAGSQRPATGPSRRRPFYWGLNGIFSVVGSVGTMVVAVTVGFTAAMLGGAAFYLVAALAARSRSGARSPRLRAKGGLRR